MPNQSTSTNEQQSASGPNVQNFFMQRMSDILTQLVTRAPSETEPTTTPNNTDANQSPNINEARSTSTTNNPPVQPPSPVQNSAATNDEGDNESDVSGI